MTKRDVLMVASGICVMSAVFNVVNGDLIGACFSAYGAIGFFAWARGWI